MAAFGQLLLQDGVWREQRVLPEGWVALATRKHIDNDNDPAGPVDWRQGYGYQYWIARHGFRGDGAHGQFCVVVPEADLVVVTTARVDDMQQVLDVLWTRLLPALDTDDCGPARTATKPGWWTVWTGLALPVVTPTEHGPEAAVRFVVEDAARGPPLPRGSALTVARDGADHLLTLSLPAVGAGLPLRPGPLGGGAARRRGPGSPAVPAVPRPPGRRRSSAAAAGPVPTPSRPTSR